MTLLAADMTEANFAFAWFVETSMDRAILNSSDLSDCVFTACSFTGAKMQDIIMAGGTSITYLDLTNADMSRANFESFTCALDGDREAQFSSDNADMSRANFRGANLAGGSIRNVNLTDADLTTLTSIVQIYPIRI